MYAKEGPPPISPFRLGASSLQTRSPRPSYSPCAYLSALGLYHYRVTLDGHDRGLKIGLIGVCKDAESTYRAIESKLRA